MGIKGIRCEGIADQLIDTAVCYLEENPQTRIEKIYFRAYDEQDLELCIRTFINDSRILTPESL